MDKGLALILTELGIDITSDKISLATLFDQACDDQLAWVTDGVYQRPILCTVETKQAWERMRQSALEHGVALSIVSGYRSVEYQAGIIRNKLNKGLSLEAILSVNAPPGFSEHHTGRALDLTSDEEVGVLTESFEQTRAFSWLTKYAQDFGFVMSYPRNNEQGYIYEPWHWCYFQTVP